MNLPREQIFQALFNLVLTAKIGANPAFVTSGRRLKLWSNVTPGDQPAIFQKEPEENVIEKVPGLNKYELRVQLIIYFRTSANPDDTPAPASQINQFLDAIETALATKPPNEKQTLGMPGFVYHCTIDGKIFKDDGALDQQGLIIIPIKIITV